MHKEDKVPVMMISPKSSNLDQIELKTDYSQLSLWKTVADLRDD